MTIHVYTIGKTAHDDGIRNKSLEVGYERLAEFLTILATVSCTHHTDDMQGVQGCGSSVI